MKKLLSVLVVSILVLGGLGAIAIPIEKSTEAKPMNTEEYRLLITVKGRLFGYLVNFSNTGNKSITGNISLYIATNAWIMFPGGLLSMLPEHFDIASGESVEFKMSPIIGFGPSTINITGNLKAECCIPQDFNALTNGFVFLFYISGSTEIEVLPTPLP